jgi:hypothetical protein
VARSQTTTRQRTLVNAEQRLRVNDRRGLYWSIIEDGVLMAMWGLGIPAPVFEPYLPGRTHLAITRRAAKLSIKFQRRPKQRGLRSRPKEVFAEART